jgi:ATP-binding cassette, subfamily B, bacterial PglK
MFKLLSYLSKRRKKQLSATLFLMILASVFEMVSLGAVVPFLTVLTDPEFAFQNQSYRLILESFGIMDSSQLLLPLTLVFILIIILAGMTRLILLYVVTKISFAIGADLSISIYRRTLNQDFLVHISRNSSEVIDGIITKTNTVIRGVISPYLTLISSVFILIGVIVMLFIIDPMITALSIAGFSFIYLNIIYYTRHKLKENSDLIAKNSTKLMKSLQEGLGGIRDVLINNNQEYFCQLYRHADLPLRRASGNNMFISGSPRFVVESIGMTLIVTLAYFMTSSHETINLVVPILGVFALGAQKVLPALQQLYWAYSTIKGSRSSLQDVLDLLDQPIVKKENSSPVEFRNNIIVENLSFRYSKASPWILNKINFEIKKGDRIGFVGPTGCGKSTLLDIIMGLLKPEKGCILSDGRPINDNNLNAWKDKISHVPQDVFLTDDTIEKNIAFGVPENKINKHRVRYAAKHAQLSNLVCKWPDGYQTIVGERGLQLSGGQKQRIGIARALYAKSEILIFDEATSALDGQTEKDLMRVIEDLSDTRNLTVLIIAHRLTTLSGCHKIMTLGGGNICEIDYDNLIMQNLN